MKRRDPLVRLQCDVCHRKMCKRAGKPRHDDDGLCPCMDCADYALQKRGGDQCCWGPCA